MDTKYFSNQSIKRRLVFAVFIILVIQVVLLSVGIFGGSIGKEFENEYLTIFDEKVLGRQNYLQDTIERYYTSLYEYENYIQEKLSEVSINKDFVNNSFLEVIVEKAVLGLRQSNATGIFVIFNNREKKEGFYIRDLEPSVNAADNSDLLFLNGPVSVARKIKLSLVRHWSSDFELDSNNPKDDFYNIPINAAIKHKGADFKDLGYWSKPLNLEPQDVEVITYSIPLINKNGSPYGVIGIDVTLDHLYSLLPYDELGENKQGAYMLSISNKGKQDLEKVLTTGPILKRIINLENKINPPLEKNEAEENIYFSSHKINLYNADNPHINEEWFLTGIIEKSKLFNPIHRLMRSILFVLLTSLLLGIFGILFVGNWFIKPVTKLINQLLNRNPNEKILLDRTNIRELDDLSKAIETMSDKIIDSASKLSQVVDMIDIPIGAFEYIIGEEQVYITDRIFNILEIDSKETNYVSAELFDNLLYQIQKHPEPDVKDVYFYKKTPGETNWLRIQSRKEKNKILGIIEDVTDEIIRRRKIEYERDLDILTQLMNRRAFYTKVKEQFKTGALDIAALVMWDLDNLKYINDTYGHDYGDQYIRLAAEVLKEFTVYNSIVARMSGDEFYVFIYGHKKKQDIRRIVENIHNKLNSTYLTIHGKDKVRIRISVGIAWYPDDSSNFEELLKYSDFAMYQIKNSNKGNIGEFDRNIYKKDSILLYGKEELNNLIENQLIEYVFQPIVSSKTGQVFAYEALMRSQLDLIKSPLDILRLAQSQSKLYEIERITFFKAMESYVKKIDLFHGAKIFINSIPNYVLTEEDINLFEKEYKDYLNKIIVEITESEQSDEARTQRKRDLVSKWGGKLALDDFGSGYNSEITLLLLSPDYIKVDMGIIRNINKDTNRQKLLRNILSYTEHRDIKVIAEGVETKEELNTLIEFGVDYLQGYYIGKPSSNPEFVQVNLE